MRLIFFLGSKRNSTVLKIYLNRALQAPLHEKTLRGRNLRISPADSWHQPAEDADGRGRWKPRGQRRPVGNAASAEIPGVPEQGTAVFKIIFV